MTFTPSLHAHEHLTWTPTRLPKVALCTHPDCGQMWLLTERGWEPAPPGTDPDTCTEDWGAS